MSCGGGGRRARLEARGRLPDLGIDEGTVVFPAGVVVPLDAWGQWQRGGVVGGELRRGAGDGEAAPA